MIGFATRPSREGRYSSSSLDSLRKIRYPYKETNVIARKGNAYVTKIHASAPASDHLSDDDSWVRLADLSGSAGFNVARMQRGRQLDILS